MDTPLKLVAVMRPDRIRGYGELAQQTNKALLSLDPTYSFSGYDYSADSDLVTDARVRFISA